MKSKGRAFSEKGEIRWEKSGNDFIVTFLTENLNSTLPKPICEYEVEKAETSFKLYSLKDKSINPKFEFYPTGKQDGKLKAYIYLKNGIMLTLRLRSIIL